MNKIIKTPDCPVCGLEMNERRASIYNGAVAFWWNCSKCKASSPKSINEAEALDLAMEWAAVRRQ